MQIKYLKDKVYLLLSAVVLLVVIGGGAACVIDYFISTIRIEIAVATTKPIKSITVQYSEGRSIVSREYNRVSQGDTEHISFVPTSDGGLTITAMFEDGSSLEGGIGYYTTYSGESYHFRIEENKITHIDK